MPVFKIDRNNKVMLNPEAAKLVPELTSLTIDQLWYVILVADYVDGPFRRKPVDERRIMASRKVFGKDKINETEKIKIALEGYKSLVFDIRRETLDALKTKVLKLHKDLLRDETTSTVIQNIDKSISFLESRIASIERDLDIEEQESIELKANRKLSMIEIWQRNQRKQAEYKSSM